MLRKWLILDEDCAGCGLRFERQEGYWVGAVAVNTVATIVVFAGTFVLALVLTWPDVPWTTVTIVVVVVNVAFPIVFYPWSKTLWLATDLAVHPVTGADLPGSEADGDGMPDQSTGDQ